MVARELPGYFGWLRAASAPPDAARVLEPTDAERAWGLMPRELYRSSVEKTLERDWAPRFARFDIDARAAFQMARSKS